MLRDLLYQLKQELAADGGSDLEPMKEAAGSCQERTSQLIADLGYLIAARTEDHAFWVEGNFEKGWTKLCGVPLDIAALLSPVWQGCRGAVVFTSATLSVARSVDYFFNGVGLEPLRERTAVSFYPAPFAGNQTIMGAVRQRAGPGLPGISSLYRRRWSATSMRRMVKISWCSLPPTHCCPKPMPLCARMRAIAKQNILAQNISGGRHALLEQFKGDRKMILLGPTVSGKASMFRAKPAKSSSSRACPSRSPPIP